MVSVLQAGALGQSTHSTARSASRTTKLTLLPDQSHFPRRGQNRRHLRPTSHPHDRSDRLYPRRCIPDFHRRIPLDGLWKNYLWFRCRFPVVRPATPVTLWSCSLFVQSDRMIVPVYQSEISPAENRGQLACIEFTGNIVGYASSVVSTPRSPSRRDELTRIIGRSGLDISLRSSSPISPGDSRSGCSASSAQFSRLESFSFRNRLGSFSIVQNSARCEIDDCAYVV